MEHKLTIFLTWLQNRVNSTGAQYVIFGLFGLINYPGSYFFWHQVIVQEYNPLSLRIIAATLCLPLIFHKQWLKNFQKFLPLYWYITVLYCLPFFGSYMLLMNHLSNAWLMNMVLGLFLFILLVDWLMFIILLLLGIILGWLFFMINDGRIVILPSSGLQLAAYMYFFAILIGMIFSRSKEKLAADKIQAAKLLAASIAHELRTPLASIIAGASGLQSYLPKLLHNYQRAQEEKVSDLEIIRPVQFEALQQSLTAIEKEASSSNLIITMLLTNLSTNQIVDQQFSVLSISYCVQQALARYPISEEMRSKINWQINEDFLFHGSEALTIHILFNLLKNAIYYIRSAQRGEIFITIDTSQQQNILYFKDTSVGIDAKDLPNIFKQFYSNTRHGTGVGLAFCKAVMKSYEGDITCRSQKGVYTEFCLTFPKISPTTGQP